jgi:hypothetical protein
VLAVSHWADGRAADRTRGEAQSTPILESQSQQGLARRQGHGQTPGLRTRASRTASRPPISPNPWPRKPDHGALEYVTDPLLI